jgi:hypothetical protein
MLLRRMRRILHSIIMMTLLLSATVAAGAAKVEMINDMVPKNWILVYYTLGDINHDGKDDAIMVVENTDTSYLKRNRILGPKILNMNPRKMLVLFQTEAGYEEVLSVANGFPTEHSEQKPCLADPLVEAGEININNGLVKVALNYKLKCSGYDTTKHTFKFRYENTRFRLVGFNAMQLERISGDATEQNFDYLAGQKTTVTGINIYDNKKHNARSQKLVTNKQFYLDEISLACEPHNQTPCHQKIKQAQLSGS